MIFDCEILIPKSLVHSVMLERDVIGRNGFLAIIFLNDFKLFLFMLIIVFIIGVLIMLLIAIIIRVLCISELMSVLLVEIIWTIHCGPVLL